MNGTWHSHSIRVALQFFWSPAGMEGCQHGTPVRSQSTNAGKLAVWNLCPKEEAFGHLPGTGLTSILNCLVLSVASSDPSDLPRSPWRPTAAELFTDGAEAKLYELTGSIKLNGLIQLITVRPTTKGSNCRRARPYCAKRLRRNSIYCVTDLTSCGPRGRRSDASTVKRTSPLVPMHR